jgi:cellulose synthase/poly-beta-1,6-N-acetylglucosamine synthase-like glycosyltransferase
VRYNSRMATFETSGQTISVIVPSYRRPDDLRLCLDALCEQARNPDEVIVVVREDDLDTRRVAEDFVNELPLQIIDVTKPGLVPALNAGLSAAQGTVIAFTDDDASPRVDWLERLSAHYSSDPTIGGVGGRDAVVGNTDPGVDSSRVGRVQWTGRCTAGHHRGMGPARCVDVLKGVNMSFTAEALAGLKFDESLRGSGAGVHCDLAISLDVRHKGWLLMYDPALVVDHRAVDRTPGDEREQQSELSVSNNSYNETRILLRYLTGWHRPAFVVWGFLAGTHASPGLAQLFRRNRQSTRFVIAAMRGRADAIVEHANRAPLS